MQGFAAGCSNGSVSIWERETDKSLFRRVWQATLEGANPCIASMALTVSESEEALLLTTAGHQMLKRRLAGSHQVDAAPAVEWKDSAQSVLAHEHGVRNISQCPCPAIPCIASMGFTASKSEEPLLLTAGGHQMLKRRLAGFHQEVADEGHSKCMSLAPLECPKQRR
jgi:hypothetical protein